MKAVESNLKKEDMIMKMDVMVGKEVSLSQWENDDRKTRRAKREEANGCSSLSLLRSSPPVSLTEKEGKYISPHGSVAS